MGMREGRRCQWRCEGHTGLPWRGNSRLTGSEGKPNPRETCVNIVGQSLDHRVTLAPMSVTHRPQHRFLTAGLQAEAQAPLAYVPTLAPSWGTTNSTRRAHCACSWSWTEPQPRAPPHQALPANSLLDSGLLGRRGGRGSETVPFEALPVVPGLAPREECCWGRTQGFGAWLFRVGTWL